MAEKKPYIPAGAKILGQMHRVMEKTREEWERETNALKTEFFNMKPGEKLLDVNGKNDRLGSVDINGLLGVTDLNDVSMETDEVSKEFKVRLSVYGFSADEIKICTNDTKLTISAKHDEVNKGKNISREFSRQIDIPSYVDPNTLKSVLGKDGILVIEALVCPPSNGEGQSEGHLSRSQENGDFTLPSSGEDQWSRSQDNGLTLNKSDLNPKNIFIMKSTIPKSEFDTDIGISEPGSQFTLKNPIFKESISDCNANGSSPITEGKCRIIQIEHDDVQRVKWIVDLGSGFDPKDITVKSVKDKLQISAKHDEGVKYKRCKKEHSKEFEIPDNVDQSTLRATVSSNGKVIIRANTFM